MLLCPLCHWLAPPLNGEALTVALKGQLPGKADPELQRDGGMDISERKSRGVRLSVKLEWRTLHCSPQQPSTSPLLKP